MKTMLIAAFVAFVAVMAGVIAYRLSSDALALVVGVLLGLLALIPTLILALLLLRRSQQPEPAAPMMHPQPPVVVVSGGYPQMLPQPQTMPYQQSAAMMPPPPPQQSRQFRLMGYESTEALDLNDDEWSSRP